jgi:hypothetical protein
MFIKQVSVAEMLNTGIREVLVRLSGGTPTIVAKVLRYFPKSLPASAEIFFYQATTASCRYTRAVQQFNAETKNVTQF